jgi:hypothetical protein
MNEPIRPITLGRMHQARRPWPVHCTQLEVSRLQHFPKSSRQPSFNILRYQVLEGRSGPFVCRRHQTIFWDSSPRTRLAMAALSTRQRFERLIRTCVGTMGPFSSAASFSPSPASSLPRPLQTLRAASSPDVRALTDAGTIAGRRRRRARRLTPAKKRPRRGYTGRRIV